MSAPTAPYGTCLYWRQLDAEFGTDPRSPLHHDQRCRQHTVSRDRVGAVACAIADLEAGFIEDPATDIDAWWAAALSALEQLNSTR